MKPITSTGACATALYLYNFIVTGDTASLLIAWALGGWTFISYQMEGNYYA